MPSALGSVSLRLGVRYWAKAVIHSNCREGLLRAQTGSDDFPLRAHAAQKMPQVLYHLCRRAAGKPAIHARCSETNLAHSQIVGFADLELCLPDSALLIA